MAEAIAQTLYDAATELAKSRYGVGWAGAAALRLENGEILTSVAPDIELEALGLCMEVGAILEAHKRNLKVTHSLCVSRESEAQTFLILSPCGICQERLRHWGPDVEVAVTTPENALMFLPLKALMPYHWGAAFRSKDET